jgi:hypothetical protein
MSCGTVLLTPIGAGDVFLVLRCGGQHISLRPLLVGGSYVSDEPVDTLFHMCAPMCTFYLVV